MSTKTSRAPTRRSGIVQAVGELLSSAAASKFNHQITPDYARLTLQTAFVSAAVAAGADPKKLPTLGTVLTSVIDGSKIKKGPHKIDPRKAEAAAIRAQIKDLRGKLSTLK